MSYQQTEVPTWRQIRRRQFPVGIEVFLSFTKDMTLALAKTNHVKIGDFVTIKLRIASEKLSTLIEHLANHSRSPRSAPLHKGLSRQKPGLISYWICGISHLILKNSHNFILIILKWYFFAQQHCSRHSHPHLTPKLNSRTVWTEHLQRNPENPVKR